MTGHVPFVVSTRRAVISSVKRKRFSSSSPAANHKRLQKYILLMRLALRSSLASLFDSLTLFPHELILHLPSLDCPEARLPSEHPVTAAGVAAVVVAETTLAALPATGLPALIFYAEVIPFRSTQPCIPLTGSTTWTTSIISSRPPLTVPTPRYMVIIGIREFGINSRRLSSLS
jgi:hypothetical protein